MRYIRHIPEYVIEGLVLGALAIGFLIISAGDKIIVWWEGHSVDHDEGWE